MLRVIRAAVDRGITFFGTAEVYGPYDNEELVGRGTRLTSRPGHRRDQVRVAHRERTPTRLDRRPEQLKKVADASLRRLRTDTIDLFHQLRRAPDVPVEGVTETVGRLLQAGKVRHFGLSEAAASDYPAPTSQRLILGARPCRSCRDCTGRSQDGIDP
ncbi:aldo/keto reductase [Streptomyces sp. NPDC056390]|uniref:aldo/keto reductase n=1 Tax=Streptomyces sp. NPDC056390 TaxID=3345806 RepID=UPI0035E1C4DC